MKTTRFRRLLSLLLVMALIFSMLSVGVSAVELPEAAQFTSILTDSGEEVVSIEKTDTANRWGAALYDVVVPAGTESVEVVYPAETPLYSPSGNSVWAYQLELATGACDENNTARLVCRAAEDGSTVVTIPVANYLRSGGMAVAPGKADTEPVNFFAFAYEAEEAETITVLDTAPATAEIKAGGMYELDLGTVFSDAAGHSLTYTLSGGDFGEHTKISDGVLYFSVSQTGTYTPTITATCPEGATASHTITITVTEADAGLELQYRYDETPADHVTVYVTINNDGKPILGNDTDQTILAHKEITVPYFDLALYDLDQFYRYHTEGGQGEYVDDKVVERPTALHLYIYLLERYYIGLPEEECCQGRLFEYTSIDGDICYMDGEPAYTPTLSSLYITGSPTSLYMANFWGHDENLMYYRNHVYPLMSPGWGSTCDYILLSDNDTIDVAMFTDWSFWSDGGGFSKFDQDDYAGEAGSALSFQTLKFGTRSVADGGVDDFVPVTNLQVALYDEYWQKVEDVAGADGAYTVTLPDKPGTYYLLGMDSNCGTEAARLAAATAKVTVTGDPFAAYPFNSIYFDDNGTETLLTNISELEGGISGEDSMYVYDGLPAYTVTVPEELAGDGLTVYIVFPEEQGLLPYGLSWSEDEGFGYGAPNGMELMENDDGTKTLVIPVSPDFIGTDKYIVAEDGDYAGFMGFTFVGGDISGKPQTVAVTGVTMSRSELSLERRAAVQLTAQVAPENATNQRVSWSSSDPSVAPVSSTGLVTAKAEGTAVITVTTSDGGYTASCTVTVTDPNRPQQDEDGTYLIGNAEELQWFAAEVNEHNTYAAVNAKLTADIDLSTVCGENLGSWQPIGDPSSHYSGYLGYLGTFDGQGHTITNLYINENNSDYTNTSSYYRGLFGYLNGATVKNITLYGSVESNNRYVAAFAGRSSLTATIENCHNYATVTCTNKTNEWGYAGIVASAGGSILNCSNHAKIYGCCGWVGGIAGRAELKTTIAGCYNEGEVYCFNDGYLYRGVGGILGASSDDIAITDCYNTGRVYQYFQTMPYELALGGILGRGFTTARTVTIENCYNTGLVTCSDKCLDTALLYGIAGAAGSNDKPVTSTNSYYLDTAATTDGSGAAAVSQEALSAIDLGTRWQASCPFPVLDWQTAKAHVDEDNDKICDVCGASINRAPVLRDGVDKIATGQAVAGTAYLLGDLQAGKIFVDPDGDKLSYQNIYWERSTDDGETWSSRQPFSEAIFGMTTICVTENEPGEYIYRFYMSDGTAISTEYWELHLTVVEKGVWDTSFYVGKDYNGNYPIVKIYPCLGTDENGQDIPDYDNEVAMLYSDFTGELPEGEEAYDPALGKLVNNYNMFYASLEGGRYSYRAFGYNSETEAYDIPLGGMALTIPTDKNVDGASSGGTNIYLRCVSYYTATKKTDGTYFTADEYHIQVDCPIMDCSATMGEVYTKSNYAYYPVMLYAGGNSCLYNYYAYPDIEGYIFTQAINYTVTTGYAAMTKTATINTAVQLDVTVPETADFGLYFQWNNFNTTEVEPEGTEEVWADRCTHNEDGTKTYTYRISKSNSNYTWRLSDPEGVYVTKAGWLSNVTADKELTYTFQEGDATNRLSHDFSNLGTAVATRDEADLMVNLDPSGFAELNGTTRVRAYRHWEIINSDAGNIMIEPDFHWDVLSGDATVETVDGGNTSGNWADITAGSGDSIIAVTYDAIDVNPENHGTHGGLFTATNPERTGVIVVSGDGRGTADADVDFNMAVGATTTRSMDWDYNYDTWFYSAKDDHPALDFAVNATGDVTVETAFVTTNSALQSSLSAFTAASADENGIYSVDLSPLNSLGNGMGGTVIIRMTDSTGTSYRLVRVAKVTITATNVSNPDEPIMPGDDVKLTFDGLYRAVNKISGVFNPTTFNLRYSAGETEFSGSLGQYQRMDNASITVMVPEDLEFAEGAEKTEYSFTNGYIYGSMYSAANPFAFLYNMTDTGVGTNFNAVTVNFYISHLADAAIEVSRKATYDVRLSVTDENGDAVEDCTIIVKDGGDEQIEPVDGLFRTLGYGDYSYRVEKDGYIGANGAFHLGSANAENVVDGVLTIQVTLERAGEDAWDGTTATEPTTDENGIYLIGSGAELAWFAQTVNSGQTAISARLTNDIELAGYNWTPIGSSTQKYAGTFDGDGHTVKNLYIDCIENYQGLFGYISAATISKLGVTGYVNTTGNYAGGITAYIAANSKIEQCFNAADVTAAKWVGGIAGGTQGNTALITDCYNTGDIKVTGTAGYGGGISACGTSYSLGAKLTNCYNVGAVRGTGRIGGVSAAGTTNNVNCYYLENCCIGASNAGGGTAQTSEELKALAGTLGEAFADDANGINDGYPVLTWQISAQLVYGDMNGDGVVDPIDATLAYAIANNQMEATEEQTLLADVNGDGVVDSIDASLIYAYAYGSLTEFPISE